MSPAEAGAIINEPDWTELFGDYGGDDFAFERCLKEWRKWHATPLDNGLRRPAAPVAGIIALAKLGVMPPSHFSPFTDVWRQHDAHCWLESKDRAWRILAIEDGELLLDSYDEKWSVPLARVDWTAVCDRAVEALKKWPHAHATENAGPSKGGASQTSP